MTKQRNLSRKAKKTETSKMFEDLKVSSTVKDKAEQQIITNLDFRSDRILLPKIVSTMSKFDEEDEIVIKARKGKITLEKY